MGINIRHVRHIYLLSKRVNCRLCNYQRIDFNTHATDLNRDTFSDLYEIFVRDDCLGVTICHKTR